jgi:acetyl esterase/lipase
LTQIKAGVPCQHKKQCVPEDIERKPRRAGVEAELQVYEGMSHAQYNFDPYAPETKEVFSEIARFLDKHLGK